MPQVRLERAGPQATLILDAPERGNSLDAALLTQLEEHLRALAEDDGVRVVLLRGAGARSFSTGYHVPSLLAELEAGPSVTDFAAHPLERALRALEELPVPSLAVLSGHAYGAGCELALTCDLRFAAAGVKLCMPPARLGVLYSATGMRRLLELVGPARTKELLFTAEAIDAERALQIGLVEHVVPGPELEARVARTAATIAANAPLSIRHTKTILRRFLAAPDLDEQALRLVADLRAECFASPDFAARTEALGRRSPPPESGRSLG